jgi:hypothetical protein
MRNIITEKQIEFIKINYPNKGSKYCVENLNLSKSTISTIARRIGVRVNEDVKIKNMSKEIIDINDYLSIDDPKIAYILGLIWTDGTVIFSNNKSKTPIIKHTCVEYDSLSSDIIFKSLNWRNFKSNNDRSIGKNRMSTNWISNRELGEYLIKNGYRDKNNGTFIYSSFDKYISHFLRGIFDGDGCITISESNLKYKQTAIYFSSSSNQNWDYLCHILDKIHVKYKIRKNIDKLGESSQIYINESVSIYNLCEFMYKDSTNIRLERKYNKYLSFIDYKKIYKRNNKLNDILNIS